MNMYDLEAVCVGYGKGYVLHNVCFGLAPGEFIAIIGPNGSGKSTLLKTMAGILLPGAGTVTIAGRDLSAYPKAELARDLAFVPQFIENLVAFRVYDFVKTGRFPFQSFFRRDLGEDAAIIIDSLQLAGVYPLRDKLLTELSGGELQLVSIARALAQSKKIILLDEPIANLDYKHAVKIMDVLYNLQSMGVTIITVLHNINMASDYCSRIIALQAGGVFFDGTPLECINEVNINTLFDIHCKIKKNPVTGMPYVYTFSNLERPNLR